MTQSLTAGSFAPPACAAERLQGFIFCSSASADIRRPYRWECRWNGAAVMSSSVCFWKGTPVTSTAATKEKPLRGKSRSALQCESGLWFSSESLNKYREYLRFITRREIKASECAWIGKMQRVASVSLAALWGSLIICCISAQRESSLMGQHHRNAISSQEVNNNSYTTC